MRSFGSALAYASPITPPSCPHCGTHYAVHSLAHLFASAAVAPLPPSRPAVTGRMVRVLPTASGRFNASPGSTPHLPASGFPSRLMPPEEPLGVRARIVRHAMGIILLGAVGILLLLTARSASVATAMLGATTPRWPLVIVAGALSGIAAVWLTWLVWWGVTGRLKRAVEREQRIYRRAQERWGRLYYCEDCRCVFALVRDQCTPVRHVRAYLYST